MNIIIKRFIMMILRS